MSKVTSIARALFALGLLVALVYFTGVREVLETLRELTLTNFSLLMLVSIPLILTSAVKWKLFLHALSLSGPAPSTMRLFGLYLVGYFINLLVPSFVGGDAVRSYYAGKKVGQHGAAAATILERYTGLVAMLALALCMMWNSSLVTWQIQLAVIVVVLGVVILSFAALTPHVIGLTRRLPRGEKLSQHLHRVQEALNLARKDRGLLMQSMGLSLLFHSFTVLNTLVAGWAVGWGAVPVQDLFVVLPLILLVGALPLAPSGLGIQEGAFYYFLQGIGATPAQALGVALVLRLKSYVLALLGGLVLWYERQQGRTIASLQA